MEPASGSVKKLDKKALEGLDARTESTKVPDEAWRTWWRARLPTMRQQPPPRGPRASRNMQEALCARANRPRRPLFTKDPKEEAERLSPVEVLDMVKKFRKGSSTLSEVLLQHLEENKKEDLLAKLLADKILLATQEKHPFCKKVLGELHIKTPQHRTYMKEHLQSSYLLGGGFLFVISGQS